MKKRLVVNVLISLEIQFLLAVSGEPVNDFIYLIFCAVFTDAFMDKEREMCIRDRSTSTEQTRGK